MAGYDISMHWRQFVLAPFGALLEAEARLAEEPDGFNAMRAGITAAFFIYHFHEVAWARGQFGGDSLADVRQRIEQAAKTDHDDKRVEDHELLGDVVNAVKHGFLNKTKLLLPGDNRVLLISPGRVMTYNEESRGGDLMVVVETEGGDRSLAVVCQNVIIGWHSTLGLPI
ncbi:hypothetical protein [Mesorhizobium sp.]|uniref:hypothetical protein n=1 Tax=Mesorhizobium sp. TaxID=1871066 RepID=UPI000FE79775|nr:hypothetical protein [Mesorhizobium sp.]RWC31565.1 MAG: hypothetical protein EOS27_10360 [Mesorhizobium sp.]TIX27828.1 MAG: hypothetical protein E5V35_04820 [Mesorhizobium sp.]